MLFLLKKLFVTNVIKQRRPRKEGGIVRRGANKYFLKTHGGISVAICKKYFLDTFAVSGGRATPALKKEGEKREKRLLSKKNTGK